MLQIAALAGRAIAVLTAFVFARILGPENYGFYGLVLALGGTINIFQDFGAGQATINLLARARSDGNHEEGRQVFKFFTVISIFALAATGLVGVLIAPYLGERFYNDRSLGQLAAIVVAATALTFFFPLATISLQVARRIHSLSILEIINKIASSLLPIILLLGGLGVFGIVTGQLAAMLAVSLVSVLVYTRLVRSDGFFPKIFRLLSVGLAWQKIKWYLKFSLEIAFSKNLIKFNSVLPILVAGYFLPTNSAIGYFKIALAYISLPIMMLDPVSRLLNVQLPQTEKLGLPRLFRRLFQVTVIGVLLSLGMALVLLLVASPAIRILFPEYEPSIRLVLPLSVYPVTMGLGVALGAMFRTLDRMKAAVVIQILTTAVLVPLSYMLIGHYHVKGLVIVTLVFGFLPNALSLIYFYYLYITDVRGKGLQQI